MVLGLFFGFCFGKIAVSKIENENRLDNVITLYVHTRKLDGRANTFCTIHYYVSYANKTNTKLMVTLFILYVVVSRKQKNKLQIRSLDVTFCKTYAARHLILDQLQNEFHLASPTIINYILISLYEFKQ